MSKKFAVFDIDGTLIRWQLFHAAVHELGKRGHLPSEDHEKIVAARKLWKNRTSDEGFREYEKVMVDALANALRAIEPSAAAEAEAAAFAKHKDQVYRYTRGLIGKLKRQGYLLFAISGSQDSIVKQIVEQYGFDDFAATRYVQKDGKFTGEVVVAAHNKTMLLKQLVAKHGVTFAGSIGIGDSEGDTDMLDMVEYPIAFNPSKKLFRHAQAAGWKIVLERKNMIYELEPRDGIYTLAHTNAE